LGNLLFPVDERRRRRREVAAPPRHNVNRRDRGVVREDGRLEALKIGAGVEPERLGERAPRVLERVERVRLPAAAVEREHQLTPQPLSERVLLDGGMERRHDLAMLAERERRLELLLESVDSQRLQPPRLAAEPGRIR
jgi:hypothetical protein